MFRIPLSCLILSVPAAVWAQADPLPAEKILRALALQDNRAGIASYLKMHHPSFHENANPTRSQRSAARMQELLLSEPGILRQPLVRRLGTPPALTVGDAENEWKVWLQKV